MPHLLGVRASLGGRVVVAGLAVPASMEHLFRGLVEQEVIDAYEQLRASNGCRKDQAGAFLGDPALVSALTSRGMAHILPHTPADPAWLRPASPDIALQGVLAGHLHRMAEDQELLAEGHRRLADTQARASSMTGRLPEHLVSVVSDRAEISELSASLVNTARKDWMTLENLATDMPLTEDFAQPPLPAADGQVRCRSIYDAAAMEDPVTRQIIAGLRRRRGAGPAAAQRADEDEARRLQHRAAPPHAERDRRGAADPRTRHHRRAAGVLRAAVGPGHTAQAAAPGTAGGPAAARPAGGAGTDGRRAQRCCDRAAAGHQRGHGAPVHHGHHRTGSASPAGSPPGPRRSAEDGSGRGVRYENRRAPWSTAFAGR